MKRFIVIIAILSLFVPGMVNALQLTQGWDETTVSAGAEIGPDGALQSKAQITNGLALILNYDTVDTNRYVVDESGEHDAILFRGDAQIDNAVAAKFGLASSLSDGAGDAVTIIDQLSDFVFAATSWTYHGWYRWEETVFVNGRAFASLGGGVGDWNATNGHEWIISTGVGTLRFDYNNGGSNSSLIVAGSGFTINTWTHVAAVNDAVNNTFRVYIGGVKKINTTAITIFSIATPLSAMIGANHSTGGAIGQSWKGRYDASYLLPGVVVWEDDFTPPTAPEGAFLTSAQSGNTNTITFEEDFSSEEIQILVGNTPAAATEFKVYVQEDAEAFGSAINVNTTTIAGETGWHNFMPGTAFTNHTSITLKIELNAPDTDTQLKAYAVKVKGVTIAGVADDKLMGGTLGSF